MDPLETIILLGNGTADNSLLDRVGSNRNAGRYGGSIVIEIHLTGDVHNGDDLAVRNSYFNQGISSQALGDGHVCTYQGAIQQVTVFVMDGVVMLGPEQPLGVGVIQILGQIVSKLVLVHYERRNVSILGVDDILASQPLHYLVSAEGDALTFPVRQAFAVQIIGHQCRDARGTEKHAHQRQCAQSDGNELKNDMVFHLPLASFQLVPLAPDHLDVPGLRGVDLDFFS